MKHPQLYTLSILFASLLVFTACSKKDRDPTLIVTVKDLSSTPIAGATVHAWPTNDISDSTGTGSGVIDIRMDQTGQTDASGDILFNFPASAILDIDVTYNLATTDSTSSSLEGHKVVKIEVIKQKEEENLFNETIYIK